MQQTIQISGIVQDSIVDGPGLRFAVFTQGCPHACPGCHNPQTHPFEGGTPMTGEQLLQRLIANPLQRGVTLTGGEPFCQAEALAPFAAACKGMGIEVAAYTGYTWEELCGLAETDSGVCALLRQLDIVIDGRYEQDKRSYDLRFRGSANQRTIDVQASLAADGAVPDRSERWNG